MKRLFISIVSSLGLLPGGIASATPIIQMIDITGGTATQSTSHPAGPAANGIDGNTGNFTHTTSADPDPWWSVDFGVDRTFNRIIVHNRDDCCADRLSEITVQVFDETGTEVFNSGILNTGNYLNSPTELVVSLPAPTTGRSIKVSRDPTSTIGAQGILSIGELQIALTAEKLLPPGTDLTRARIRTMTVSQSSTFNANYPAGNAVDGNFGNFTHTASADNASWWEVDFGELMLLEQVSIFNRTSCCASRLRDITVTVYDDGGLSVFTSELLNPENALGFAGTSGGRIDLDLAALNGGAAIPGQTLRISRTPDPDNSGIGAGETISTTDANVVSLAEVTVLGSSDLGPDTEPDNMPDKWETFYGLNVGIDDSGEDREPDGLTNLEEFNALTDPTVADTDGDGLDDGPEIKTYMSNPNLADTDGDGLSDGDEVNTHGSSPLLVDTDEDGFSDPVEVAEGTLPNDDTSVPFLTKVTTLGGLLGGDITDPEDDGAEGPGIGTNFNWINITSSSESYFDGFGGGEGAFDVFDNKVGGGEAKWCCNAAPQNVTVQFRAPYSITHFTMSSSNDTPARDPVNWAIQGSNDGVTWTDIYPAPGSNDAAYVTNFWTARNQTLRFDLPEPSSYYFYFRYQVDTTGGANHALGEIEYFGTVDDTDTDMDLMPDWFENLHTFLDPGDPDDADRDEDGEGLSNREEYEFGSDPGLADTDGDGLDDKGEQTAGTDPNLPDTDGDLFPDGLEVARGSDPNDPFSTPTLNPITWDTPQNITGLLSDFDTTGALVAAYSGEAATVTVGGIPFGPGLSLGGQYVGFDPWNRGNDLDYETLLNGGTHSGADQLLVLTGLKPGQDYLLQIWVADTRNGAGGRVRTFTTDPTFGDLTQTADVDSGSFGAEIDYPGQYVVGTFTADSDTQYIVATSLGVYGPQFNALMLRQTSGVIAAPVITGGGFAGSIFELTVSGLDIGTQYLLKRSTSLQGFAPLGDPFTAPAETITLQDPAPPADQAYYLIEVAP